jgi:four helix bundle protein
MRSYRSLGAWQSSHRLCLLVLRVADDAYHPRAAALLQQMRRAAISVEANIVEGYALGTAPLFRRHLRIALGSAAELECLIHVGHEMEYLPPPSVGPLNRLVDETLRRLYGLVRSPRLRSRN